ncbi:DUF2207 domain-containing protein [Aeromicrobium wangtongii]|uniref:DUF2207 domain-containing protein n=1 Tax=Aeromicrobium wangtongii TaxID=2969247 RepID=A0ABY5M543_9ACTN|nr:DUF2207 domain-containing protein [Aeromicrobium wangtongii]MCD9198135.1 DUF2207 domain-containing protein [Aeromicrobium wangtongii]UUP12174.1 DUF2207 domain-containing protein [Aeromicrobium wangtongii]
MNRNVLRVVALLVTAALVVLPAVVSAIPSDETPGPDPVRITDYRVDQVLTADGTLVAKETLTTQFPAGRHGIFRFWDLKDPQDEHVRLNPEKIRVQMDGDAVPVELQWQMGRRLRVAKIGDPDSTVPAGEHTYTISYVVKGALAPASAGGGSSTSSWAEDEPTASVFYWNVIPQGWQTDIDRTTIRMTLPAAAGPVQCTSGLDSSGECEIEGEGTDVVTVSTGALPPHTPVTVRIGLPVATPDRVSVPWPVAADRALGRSVGTLAGVLVLAIALGVLGYLLERRSREDEPGFPVMYEPPAGLGPVQTAYLADEAVPQRGLVATLLYQAEQGLTTLTRNDDDSWTIVGVGDADAWSRTDDITRFVGTSLGVTDPGATFTASKEAVEAGETLQATKAALAVETGTWADGIGVQRQVSSEVRSRLAVMFAGIALLVVGIIWHPPASVYLLPLGAFVIGGAGLLTRGVGTRRTTLGRELWSKAGGFERLLSTTSAKDRFDFSGRRELYTAFVPYAVAFDCADRWARKYETSTGTPAPTPVWLAGGAGVGASARGGDPLGGFESSLAAAVGAYAATQSSSSSGGGGGSFSGGGGGGGGGGGSW